LCANAYASACASAAVRMRGQYARCAGAWAYAVQLCVCECVYMCNERGLFPVPLPVGWSTIVWWVDGLGGLDLRRRRWRSAIAAPGCPRSRPGCGDDGALVCECVCDCVCKRCCAYAWAHALRLCVCECVCECNERSRLSASGKENSGRWWRRLVAVVERIVDGPVGHAVLFPHPALFCSLQDGTLSLTRRRTRYLLVIRTFC